jgi:hypothetical protein
MRMRIHITIYQPHYQPQFLLAGWSGKLPWRPVGQRRHGRQNRMAMVRRNWRVVIRQGSPSGPAGITGASSVPNNAFTASRSALAVHDPHSGEVYGYCES